MTDLSHINLLELTNSVGIKKVANTNGGEYHGSCPFCGGKDRFIVQPNAHRWSCRQCHPYWGNAIEFIACRDNLNLKDASDFRTALSNLNIKNDSSKQSVHKASMPHLSPICHQLEMNHPSWMKYADAFAEYCQAVLFSDDGNRAFDYLLQRGISSEVIEQANLGLNPKPYKQSWHSTDVYIPRAIIVPWYVGNDISGVRYRTTNHQFKWATGSTGKALYNANSINTDSYVVLVESEICCLVLKSTTCSKEITPVATGGVSGGRLINWIVALSLAKHVFIAFDNDEAGNLASNWWLEKLSNASRLLPTQKDPGDMYLAGESLSTWIKQAIINLQEKTNV